MVMHSVVMEGLTEEVTFEQTLGSWGSRKKQGGRILLGGERKGLGVGVCWALSAVSEGSVARAETKKAE